MMATRRSPDSSAYRHFRLQGTSLDDCQLFDCQSPPIAPDGHHSPRAAGLSIVLLVLDRWWRTSKREAITRSARGSVNWVGTDGESAAMSCRVCGRCRHSR